MGVVYKTGDILTSTAEYLVNPTNFQGPMGGGLARQFANRFYGLEEEYCRLCESNRYGPLIRQYHLIPIWRESTGVRIINFATMDLGEPAKMDDVATGLTRLQGWFVKSVPTSVAFPKIGCGIGGLDWADVKPLIEFTLGRIDGLTVEIWE